MKETAAEAHSRRISSCGEEAAMPRKVFFTLKDGFHRQSCVFACLCVLKLIPTFIRVSGVKLWGLFQALPLCRGVFIPPGRFWARVTQEWKVLPICCAAGRRFLAQAFWPSCIVSACVWAFCGCCARCRRVLGLLWLVLRGRAAKSVESGFFYMRTADSSTDYSLVSCPFCCCLR